MLFVCLTSFVYANAETRVEIHFRVGDNVLKINGAEVQVETPYVVGEGVTLVPLRVITEAFGATVGWEEATQTVTLDYPNVNIVLQIGNPIAEVNARQETLLAAPELPNSSTMVPLRFISETFGATVTYNEATAEISVVKEIVDNTPTLIGGISSAEIGDSYYGWSMENTQNFEMTERNFNGALTTFSHNENNHFSIIITPLSASYNFNIDRLDTKSQLGGDTVIVEENDAAAKTIHYQKQDDTYTYTAFVFVGEKYRFELLGKFERANASFCEEALRLMRTFRLHYIEDAFDISTVTDGWRSYENKTMQLTMQIPANYIDLSDKNAYNEFIFCPYDTQDTVSRIHMNIFSKTDTLDAKACCEADYAHNTAFLNPNYVKFTAIEQENYPGFTAYVYAYTTPSFDEASYVKDVFWEVGDYIYNASITVKMPHNKPEAAADAIIEKITTAALDGKTIGTIIRNTTDYTSVRTIATDAWSLDVPYCFDNIKTSNTSFRATDTVSGMTIKYELYENQTVNRNAASYLSTEMSADLKTSKTVKVKDTTPIEINGIQALYHELRANPEGQPPISTLRYAFEKDGSIHMFTITVNTCYLSTYVTNTAKAIIASLTLKTE